MITMRFHFVVITALLMTVLCRVEPAAADGHRFKFPRFKGFKVDSWDT